MRALREAGIDIGDPRAELLAAAYAGDKYAQWRADELFVNWRRNQRTRVEE